MADALTTDQAAKREKTVEKYTCRECRAPIVSGWTYCRKCAKKRKDERVATRADSLKRKRADDLAANPRVCADSDCDRDISDRHYNAKFCEPCSHRRKLQASKVANAREAAARRQARKLGHYEDTLALLPQTMAIVKASSNGKGGASKAAKAWARGKPLPDQPGDTPLTAADARILSDMFHSDYSATDAGARFAVQPARPCPRPLWGENPEIEDYFPPPPLSPDRRGVRVIGRRFAAPKEGDHI